MRAPRTAVWVCVAGTAGVLVAIGILKSQHTPAKMAKPSLPVADNVPRPKEADRLYVTNPKVAAKKYKEFVEKHAATKDPVVQDQVGTARLKIGYIAAHEKNWVLARESFLEADEQTKGTKRTSDFGTVNEQGAYQAIVTLEASGKVDEAKKQYRLFIEQRPMSGLCMACYRRLVRLNGGKPTEELTRLIESATKQQDANTRFESAVCGPKTLAYLCQIGAIKVGTVPCDYKSIAKFCGTTDSGTTVEGMIKGIKALGGEASAYRVNRQDLEKVQLPAIILIGDHFVTLLEVKPDSMKVYDTVVNGERAIKIPDLRNPDFYVNAILLRGSL